VRDLPEELDADALPATLADGWGFEVASAEYAPVGGGSYHWIVRDGGGTRGFVTVDDLDRKAWLGDSRDAVFGALGRAFDTSLALREAGLEFVAAPIPSRDGATVRHVDARHTIALFPFLDGRAGTFGEYTTERPAVLAMLAELHRATPVVESVARRVEVELPGRGQLDAALRELEEPWSGGPFSQPAREALAAGASTVTELIALADRLSADLASRGVEHVVTHGEPHAANVMRVGETHFLIDWDTVALAAPERDLWMLAGEDTSAYTDATGHEVDEAAVSFYRLAWDLGDLSEYLTVLRAPHRRTRDTERAYESVRNFAAN
jgi:spectinomycin phosphotransferase